MKTKLLKGYSGMTLWPFLLIAERGSMTDEVFMNHEKIHARQQKELLIMFFYVWYISEYLFYRIKYAHRQAYLSISFEREAYANEHNLHYLKERRAFAFMNFVKKKK